jgi:hypothetical protein
MFLMSPNRSSVVRVSGKVVVGVRVFELDSERCCSLGGKEGIGWE